MRTLIGALTILILAYMFKDHIEFDTSNKNRVQIIIYKTTGSASTQKGEEPSQPHLINNITFEGEK
jgi:hypothetical protein